MRLQRLGPFSAIAPCLLVIFFVIKAAITGIWVVRPWDVPDEVGHFSYIMDLATGNGLPVLHETRIDEEVWRHFARETSASPGSNWIAQHPPLYHLLMIPAYWVGSLFGSSFWGSFFCIRLMTSLIFGLGLFTLVKAFQEAKMSFAVSLGLGLMLACIPNHTYLASAVNHDAMVFLFGSLVLLYWIRYSKSGLDADLTRLGVVLGLGGLVKYTFLVLFPPVLILVGVVMWRGRTGSAKTIVTFLGLAFAPIVLWMLRNWLLLGELLPVDTTGFHSDQPLEMSLLEFGRSYPIFSILTRTYWGLFGWLGDGTLQVRWMQIYSIYQQAYSWPLFLLLILTLVYQVKENQGKQTYLSYGVCGLVVAVLSFISSQWWKFEYVHYLPLFFVGIAVLGWCLAEGCYYIRTRDLDSVRIAELGSVFVFLFFLIVHLFKIYSFSLPSGALQGTFGRYYVLVVGFLVVGLLGKGLRAFPFGAQLVMVFAMIYSSAELYVWLHEAIPFFYVHG